MGASPERARRVHPERGPETSRGPKESSGQRRRRSYPFREARRRPRRATGLPWSAVAATVTVAGQRRTFTGLRLSALPSGASGTSAIFRCRARGNDRAEGEGCQVRAQPGCIPGSSETQADVGQLLRIGLPGWARALPSPTPHGPHLPNPTTLGRTPQPMLQSGRVRSRGGET
jgi:hypothetical protein